MGFLEQRLLFFYVLVAMAPGVVECDMSKVPLKSASVQVIKDPGVE